MPLNHGAAIPEGKAVKLTPAKGCPMLNWVGMTPNERTMVERQIEVTDGQIDALVYELYGLTEEARMGEGR